ncbi:hypothetical protein EW146_g2114 [Bondarzewia mesenterica]|uniref:ATP-dependent DNA helicase n=1 Tax=Bondarzewia mesenterica TaxID=1095465 RepID=A0A4S4M3K9_9AGAM|nr:hypothetical protein EW146_g2114 [Bondarzewia mesenterica]
MGKLNIAHHKSYHPYRLDNIARVRRDEEEAKLKEQQEEDRALLAVCLEVLCPVIYDAESRLNDLRQRAGLDQGRADEEITSTAGPSNSEAVTNSTPLSSTGKHINLFEDLEQQSIVVAARASKKTVSAAEAERGFPLAPTTKDLNPWYSTRKEEKPEEPSDDRRLRDLARKSHADPLSAIPPHIRSKAPSSSSSSSTSSAPSPPATASTLEARLSRESSERARALALVKRKQREREATATPSTVHGGYGDVFNREEVEAAHKGWGRKGRENWRDRSWDEGNRSDRRRWEGGGGRGRRIVYGIWVAVEILDVLERERLTYMTQTHPISLRKRFLDYSPMAEVESRRIEKSAYHFLNIFDIYCDISIDDSDVMKRSRSRNFEADARVLSSITKEKLEVAEREEERNHAISDPAVRALRRHVHATAARVKGSDSARHQLRSQIWSTSVEKGPPTMWITINPCDLHDPIPQIYAGESIDMDQFVATSGPDKAMRANNIAKDPYAAAKFFHFIIRTVLETLFQIRISGAGRVWSGKGVLGKVAAYFGTVESQGRGTLHLHQLIWLEGAPSSTEMQGLLQTEVFRERVTNFIAKNIRAFLPGLGSKTEVSAIENEKEIGYNRPPLPGDESYEDKIRQWELRVARSKQVHTCQRGRCLIVDSKGHLRCKRGAPFSLNDADFIDDAGRWGPKREFAMVNGWMPAISINCRCNNDAKLLTNGGDTKNLTWYVTTYAAKKQNKHHNLSAVMAKAHAYHLDHTNYTDSLCDDQRKMIFRVVQTINHQQELAAPMVISYLMGWDDTYKSHQYSTIFVSSILGAILHEFPNLKPKRRRTHGAIENVAPELSDDSIDTNRSIGESSEEDSASLHASTRSEMAVGEQDIDDIVTLDTDETGKLYTKSQVVDYRFRGSTLDNMGLIDFFVETYESERSKDLRKHPKKKKTATERQSGRPMNDRVPYATQHPKHKTLHRIIRSIDHNTLPNFVGFHLLPRSDDTETHDYYCACMLALMKPWRDLCRDLKSADESWQAALESFLMDASPIIKKKDHDGNDDRDEDEDDLSEDIEDEDDEEVTEERLSAFIASETNHREKVYAQVALSHAIEAGIFSKNSMCHRPEDISAAEKVVNANERHLQLLNQWREQMKRDVLLQNDDIDNPAHSNCSRPSIAEDRNPAVTPLDLSTADIQNHIGADEYGGEQSLSALDPSLLNDSQKRAYDIVSWHLTENLADRSPPPLRMILHGEGGTGKSKVIQTITEKFVNAGAKKLLAKGAYTGIAASLINGKTTHILCAIPPKQSDKISDMVKKRLQSEWADWKYLIIDEYSMIGKTFLAKLSKNISVAKQTTDHSITDCSFGGISVILCGDHHQFPPVARSKREALYWPTDVSRDNADMQIGRAIFEEFDVVVQLTEQIRVTDARWNFFLRHLRLGQVTEDDTKMLHSQVLHHSSCPTTDFSQNPWKDAALVTSRHTVRKEWNDHATKQHCLSKGVCRYICNAEDRMKANDNRQLTLVERFALAKHTSSKNGNATNSERRTKLSDTIELAIGMKVMVTSNLATDLDVTNGARGEITEIILHPGELLTGNDDVVHLREVPLYILIKMQRTRASKLDHLDDNIIPIEPSSQSYRVNFKERNGKPITKAICRRQFSITAAYAFTDYRSQGQTISHVLVDIASPPTGKLSLFNLYVALSRSSGRDTIRLLRDFDDEVFMASHDSAVLEEDDRLYIRDRKTTEWWIEIQRN